MIPEKKSWAFPQLSSKKQSAKMKMNSLSHFLQNFFGKIPILDPIFWSNEQESFPSNSLNEWTILFRLEANCIIFTDLRSTRLFIRGRVFKVNRTRLDNAEETLLVNNALHSLLSNCEIYVNNEQVHNSRQLCSSSFRLCWIFRDKRNEGTLISWPRISIGEWAKQFYKKINYRCRFSKV